MRTKITDYRGFEISFDTEDERFYADIEGSSQQKQSFASAKKYVDDYVKENNIFKSFDAERKPTLGNPYPNIITITGIRKDKRFVYNGDGVTNSQLSEYYENDYILINQANNVFKVKLADLRDKIDALKVESNVVEAQLVIVTLKEVKAQYTV